jgi:serine/threonine protein kinase
MDPLEALVADFVESRERGEALEAHEFLARHPEGGERLKRALEALEQVAALLPDDAQPVAIGPYRVRREVGRGGMGRIYEVERDGCAFALKLLHARLEDDPRALERFRREGEALTRLSHPHLVRLHEAGLHRGRPFLVMELVRGETLAHWIERHLARHGRGSCVELPGSGTPLERVLEYAARTARAIAAAHAVGVLHRDLNPRNVLVREDGTPLVIDFGLVRSSDAPTLTRTGDLLGTPQYLSPEQARGERVDERTDVYALGGLVYELTCGQPPRSGRESLALIHEAAGRPLRSIRARNAQLPRAVERIVQRATSWRSAWRYASAAALAQDLEDCVAGRLRAPPRRRLFERMLDTWLLHRRALSLLGALTLVASITYLVIAARPEQRARRVAELHARAACAWLDEAPAELARVASELERFAPADPYTSLAVALAAGKAPTDTDDPSVRAWIAAQDSRAAGRYGEAWMQARTANNVRQGAPLAVAALARAAQEAGDLAFAQDLCERHASMLGGSHVFHELLSRVYLARGMHLDACVAAEAAIALAPTAYEAYLALTAARLAVGDSARARNALAAAAERGAPDARLAALREALRALDMPR